MKKLSKISRLDKQRTVTVAEFERLFDEGSDEIDAFIDWSKVEVQAAPVKRPVTLRLDADLVEWFKSFGKGYQTRINAVLQSYKKAREKRCG